jgi:predicted enzyme related to lactoylglutathione lyase
MPNPFVWYDLATTDTKGAEAFYHSVVGWSAHDSGLKDRPYILLSMGSAPVGGLMPIPEEAAARGVPPMWMAYIGVDDVDAYAARVTSAGGSIKRGPEDIPNGIGRFAVVADPQGAPFVLFKGMGSPPADPLTGADPGRVSWHELWANEFESEFAFYSSLFGWTKTATHDMGPMGIYQIFSTGDGDAGGMLNKPPQAGDYAYWLLYFNVPSADTAVERINQAGGKVLQGPHQVPGGSWIVQAIDPQGAVFAIAAPKR